MFVHCVFLWLNDSNEANRQKLADDARTLLKDIHGVRNLFAGRPAMTPRDVVDNSYDVGICVVLDDRAGHDVYQEHPLHKEFGARNRPTWKRLQVSDFA